MHLSHDSALALGLSAPLVIALLGRLVRRGTRVQVLRDLPRGLRDLLTLRMVLRDTSPEQRAGLLDAHRAWRCGTTDRPSSR
ncbi:hypothetical protein [Streptomyces sp. NBC_01205]|uniref:hypothetical protein n=1 Tax=Streptomyces sp. NBC_01205 TaxID=2903771 RepID=UPI002E15C5E4|nr:hypothetical protein OG573_35805 [Streptomyces sp. NBC_01205]